MARHCPVTGDVDCDCGACDDDAPPRRAAEGGPDVIITQEQAQSGDVLLDSGDTVWQRGAEPYNWATFNGLVGFYGPWDPATMGPQGELDLLVRNGQRVAA